ncbi:MAG: transposase [Planctomycetes bacterium]|nr:transposase [Planctomycetota bacterium]
MQGENGKKKRFDRDFKISTVKMVTEGGHTAAEVARSLGIHPTQIYNWKRKFSDSGDKAFPGKGHLSELAGLRRQLREVEMERDILKKATAYFARESL